MVVRAAVRRLALLASAALLCAVLPAAGQHTDNSASAHYYDPPGPLANVACQDSWIQSGKASDFGGFVTAWHNTNTPTYNAQCGKCIKLTSTASSHNQGYSIYVTVVDLKGWLGFDVNVPAWQTLFGTTALDVYSISYQEVDPCLCTGNKKCGTPGTKPAPTPTPTPTTKPVQPVTGTSGCTDTSLACPGWGSASCIYPGVPEQCPKMCGRACGTGTTVPGPAPTPTPGPTTKPVTGGCTNASPAECAAWGAASCIFLGVPEKCAQMCGRC